MSEWMMAGLVDWSLEVTGGLGGLRMIARRPLLAFTGIGSFANDRPPPRQTTANYLFYEIDFEPNREILDLLYGNCYFAIPASAAISVPTTHTFASTRGFAETTCPSSNEDVKFMPL